jgi:spore maturation protein CgeB
VQHDPSDPLVELIPQYDFILTYGGGQPVVGAYEALGARTCVPIYNAVDPSTHFPVAPDPRLEGDLGFLGNRLPDREKRVEEFFLEVAEKNIDQRFILGGNGWADRELPGNVNYVGHVYTADHNAFNCSTRAVVNISRESMARYGYSPATRVFEAAGAAACIITDYWEGIDQFLEPDREVLVARNGLEVSELIRSLTARQARELGWKAQARVLSEHTYAHRARQLDHLLGGSASAGSGLRSAPRAVEAML